MNYQVVSMQQSHIPKLAQIERACFHAPWSEAALQEELGKGIFLVALDAGGIPVGYVGCQTVLDEGYITNVAVCPDHRRQGIAALLLQELVALCRGTKTCLCDAGSTGFQCACHCAL